MKFDVLAPHHCVTGSYIIRNCENGMKISYKAEFSDIPTVHPHGEVPSSASMSLTPRMLDEERAYRTF